jgi:hypothetical protein
MSADQWCGRFQTDRVIKDFGAEIDTYRSASYVQQFGIEVSDRQCEHGVAAIAERKSR